MKACEGEKDRVVQLIHKHVGVRDLFEGAQELTGVEEAAEAIMARPPAQGHRDNIDLAAQKLAGWIGYVWDGLRDGRIVEWSKGGFTNQWTHGGVGGTSFQGGKQDLRDIAAEIARLAAVPAEQDIDAATGTADDRGLFAIPAAGMPAGFKLVPINPTEKMIVAGAEANQTQWSDETPDTFSSDVANDVYRAMVYAVEAPRQSADETRGVPSQKDIAEIILSAMRHSAEPGVYGASNAEKLNQSMADNCAKRVLALCSSPAVNADRESFARAIRRALVENWKNSDTCEAWEEDVLLTGCRKVGSGQGYQKPEEAAQRLALDAADAILALRFQPEIATEEDVATEIYAAEYDRDEYPFATRHRDERLTYLIQARALLSKFDVRRK